MITLRRNCSSSQYLADDSLESNQFTIQKNIVAIGKFVQGKGISLTLPTSIFYLQQVVILVRFTFCDPLINMLMLFQ